MGGIGSGRRWHDGAKDTTDDYRALDIRYLNRNGLLTPGYKFNLEWSREGNIVATIGVRTESGRVVVTYRQRRKGKDWKEESYPIRLDWTRCNYGSERPWFLCPMKGCGKRVAILYNGGIFACRNCHRLAYPSQRETDDDRATRRANKLRERLGWIGGILDGNGLKKRGMHWKTYKRLVAEHDALVAISLTGIPGEYLDGWL